MSLRESFAVRLYRIVLITLSLFALVSAPPQCDAASFLPPFPWSAKDFSIVFDGDRFHIFYIRHNPFIPDNSNEREFGHAVSTDLVSWTELDSVLWVRPSSWDNLHVWAPTVVWSGATYAMLYTGVTSNAGSSTQYQRTGLATSPDLMNWTRLNAPVFSCLQVPWVYCDSTVAAGGDFRDPFLMPDPDSPGHWLMYYATRLDAVRDWMVVGLAASAGDLTLWSDRKPMWNTDPIHSFSVKIESPHVFDHDGLWYLFYTTNSGHPINFETSSNPTADSLGWSNQVHLSSEITTESTDLWFASEHLRAGPHDYFCAASSGTGGIEIREMVWDTPPHFHFAEPSVASVPGDGRIPSSGAGLRFGGHGAGTAAWTLEVSLDSPAPAQLRLVDLSGRCIRDLADRPFARGTTKVEWDGRGTSGVLMPSGIYFAVLKVPGAMCVARVPLVR